MSYAVHNLLESENLTLDIAIKTSHAHEAID